MKAIIVPALAALALAHAISPADSQALRIRDFQPVALNFQAGPVSYDLNFVADGQEYFTSTFKKNARTDSYIQNLNLLDIYSYSDTPNR